MGRRHPVIVALALLLPAACGEADRPDDDLTAVKAPPVIRIVEAEEAVAGAFIPTLDPQTLVIAEIDKALPAGPRCVFRYTRSGKPVLAVTVPEPGATAEAVLKINGNLVRLNQTPSGAEELPFGGYHLSAGPLRLTLAPDPEEPEAARAGRLRREANLRLHIGEELDAGYRGYLDCPAPPAR